MNELLEFLQNNGPAMLSLLASISYFALRFIRTGKSYDFLRWLLNVLDNFKYTADRKAGSGKHISRKSHID